MYGNAGYRKQRSTWYHYRHYWYDWLRCKLSERYLLNDFLSYFSTDTQSVALNLTECELVELVFICDKYITPYLTYIRDHKEVFGTALTNNKTLGFEDVYKRMFENIFNHLKSYPFVFTD